jgi:Fe2+ transport system protein FeoA
MSRLTENTDYRALLEIAQTLPHFERLSDMGISAGDAVRIRHAENIIKDVIGNNGYQILYRSRNIALRKIKEVKQ